jgi:hypothetical protein
MSTRTKPTPVAILRAALNLQEAVTLDIRQVTDSTDFQALLTYLKTVRRPFGVCVAIEKEAD